MNRIRISWCQLTSALVSILIILQLFYAALLSQFSLQNELDDLDRKAFIISKSFEKMKTKYEDRHVMDTGGQYSIVRYIWRGGQMKNDRILRDVSLVTHCTVNRMYQIAEIARLWRGPISVVIFAPGQDAIVAMEHIIRLEYCDGSLLQRTVFHFVVPMTFPARDIKMYSNLEDRSICRLAYKEMKATKDIGNYGIHGIKYPNNLLRNVGIQNSLTEYVMVVDSDIAPKRSLHQSFLEFAFRKDLFSVNKTKERVAYVVPVFETINEESVPYDKTELFKGLKDGFIRQFYIEPCPHCQGRMDYDKWIEQYKKLQDSDELDVAYFQDWSYPWEPFYVAHRSLPLYDERFKQYGFNRISQVCELNIADYRFAVLNHAFLIHMGHKLKHGFHKNKDNEQITNKRLFHQFKQEVKTKYPQSSRQC